MNASPAVHTEMISLIASDKVKFSDISLNLSGAADEVSDFKENSLPNYEAAKAAMKDVRDARNDKAVLVKVLQDNASNDFFRQMVATASETDAHIAEAGRDQGYTVDTSTLD